MRVGTDVTTPHPDREAKSIVCAIVTVSDTRSPADDRSGQLIADLLTAAGHEIRVWQIVRDDRFAIETIVRALREDLSIQVAILTGGTGIAPRDVTYEAISGLLDKEMPGFGEIFRSLSYQEIGTRAMSSRAIAGICNSLLIFALPGSVKAVKLGMEKLILPELQHLTNLLSG
jgi:molybdenum cofactor biosynthesis protein B